jgi:PIN domain nuclease of toxin-antitoxin system
MVVLDTCAVIESCKTPTGLSRKALKQMNMAACLLSISFAEIACKVKLGKLEIEVTTHELFDEFRQINHIKIIDIGVKEWLNAVALDWSENKDPADRVIVAFAKQKQLSIVTNDKKIKEFYKNVIW